MLTACCLFTAARGVEATLRAVVMDEFSRSERCLFLAVGLVLLAAGIAGIVKLYG